MRALVVGLVVLIALTACSVDDGSNDEAPSGPQPGGIGMTYGGKVGTNLGGGLVLPYDGSGVSMGYGF